MLVDYWAHAHADEPKLHDEVVDEDFDAELDALEAESLPPKAADAIPDANSPDDDGEIWDSVVEDQYS